MCEMRDVRKKKFVKNSLLRRPNQAQMYRLAQFELEALNTIFKLI